ncbi:MAG: hypothetical protein Q9210_004526 [Variospora velana]
MVDEKTSSSLNQSKSNMRFQTLVVTLALGETALASPVNLAPRVLGDALSAGPGIIDSVKGLTTSTIGATGQEVTDVVDSSKGVIGATGQEATDTVDSLFGGAGGLIIKKE